MCFSEEFVNLFQNLAFWILLSSILGAFLLAALLGCFQGRELFFAVALTTLGLAELALQAFGISKTGASVLRTLEVFLIGLDYTTILIVFKIKAKVSANRKKRAEILKRLQYTLPSKDNPYVKERLQTTLKQNVDEKKQEPNEIVRLEHVRKLLSKVRNAPLTKAERLETEEMAKTFALYMQKSKWTVEDVRAMNELFSALLKISAKYAV